MHKNTRLLIGIVGVLLVVSGLVAWKAFNKPNQAPPQDEKIEELLPPADSAIIVTVAKSRSKDNTVVMSVSGLGTKYLSIGYELTYDSQGLIKGVNSGSKPLDVVGKDGFDREVYLGTCSRNVCKPDAGVKKVSVVLEFTDTSGKKSQFSKDYTL